MHVDKLVNQRNPDSPVHVLKMTTIYSEQDLECFSTSECHSSEHNSTLLMLATFLKEQLVASI